MAAERFEASAAGARGRSPREMTPVQRALALLVRREHSRKELARKLVERGVETDVAVEAVDKLAGEGWQSDARFAEMVVRTRVAHGQGPVRIRAELGSHGLDGEAIDAALEAFEGGWRRSAHDLAQRRFGVGLAAAGDAERRKVADFLYRRGFDGDTVRSVLRGDPED